jgi:hypothetical protein
VGLAIAHRKKRELPYYTGPRISTDCVEAPQPLRNKSDIEKKGVNMWAGLGSGCSVKCPAAGSCVRTNDSWAS